MKNYTLKFYQTKAGNEPCKIWLDSLDYKNQKRILIRLDRVRLGNFGDYKLLEKDLYELRFFYGPGYRLYFGIDSDQMVLLLNGGNKDSQKKDIEKTKIFWSDYLSD